MLKPLAGVVALSIMTLFGPTSPMHGCQRAGKALTDLYPEKRDMRHSIALLPQRGFYRAPDSASVPITNHEVLRDVAVFDATFRLRSASSHESVMRGEAKYRKVCLPCHGTGLDGNGPVWQSKAFPIPPANLLAPTTVGRTDGYIYRYIRFGGAVMPSYGAQVTSSEAEDLVHYVRAMQQGHH